MENRRLEYQILLDKFTGNIDLLSLIEEFILDEEREKEMFYRRTGHYPEPHDRLMKLKFDLLINEKRKVDIKNG